MILDDQREKMERLRFMNIVPPLKSKRYLDWLKRKDPQKDIHHILGSHTGIRMTDFLAILVSRVDHQRAEMHKAKYFMFYLPEAIKNLTQYIKHLERRLYD